MSEWWMPATAAVALTCLAVVVTLLRAHRSTRRELRAAREEQQELRRHLEGLTASLPGAAPASPAVVAGPEFVITDLDAPAEPADRAVATRLEGRLFADIVLRESLVKAASWAYGVRRALSAEQRNRVRFEVRRETRRSARQRRADTKEALRQYYARESGDVA